MRLRKKPWIAEAIKEYNDIVILEGHGANRGKWNKIFGNDNPIYVELGTGKGNFIVEMAASNPNINFIGIEAQLDIIYYAAKKGLEKKLSNLKLLHFDITNITDIFDMEEISRIFINFCDPWPKRRNAKRRLTHVNFLNKYKLLLKPGSEIHFKTDNENLFEFSLNEFASLHMYMRNITFDLHNSGFEGNIMTEYEEKFSSMGMKIFRCEVSFA